MKERTPSHKLGIVSYSSAPKLNVRGVCHKKSNVRGVCHKISNVRGVCHKISNVRGVCHKKSHVARLVDFEFY